MDNLCGKKFGRWTVIDRDVSKHNCRGLRWNCICDCGTHRSVFNKYLISGKSTSCGCLKKEDLSGKRFGSLTVIETLYKYSGYNRATYKCKCDCGNIVFIKSSSIKKIKSCGCANYHPDISGKRFAKLTVQKMIYGTGKSGQTLCKCICDCGNTITVYLSRLKSGNTASCGCKHSPSLIGHKYGRLLVIEEVKSFTPQRVWKCKCDCGTYVEINSYRLTSGHTSSCGCLRSELHSKNEVLISHLLKTNNVNFIREKTFENCKNIKALRFDFYLPNQNICIEYNGLQHYKAIEYFGGIEKYNQRKQNDLMKAIFCKDNNIRLVIIPYTYTTQKIEDLIKSIIEDPVTTTVA